jgi:hypothetical protein
MKKQKDWLSFQSKLSRLLPWGNHTSNDTQKKNIAVHFDQNTGYDDHIVVGMGGLIVMTIGTLIAFTVGELSHGFPSSIHSSSFSNQILGWGIFLFGLLITVVDIFCAYNQYKNTNKDTTYEETTENTNQATPNQSIQL